MVIEQAMGLPASRSEDAARYLAGFVESAKSSGFVAEALKRHHIQGAAVAPAPPTAGRASAQQRPRRRAQAPAAAIGAAEAASRRGSTTSLQRVERARRSPARVAASASAWRESQAKTFSPLRTGRRG